MCNKTETILDTLRSREQNIESLQKNIVYHRIKFYDQFLPQEQKVLNSAYQLYKYKLRQQPGGAKFKQ